MNDTQQKQLGSTLWAIADKLRGAMNADDFRDYMLSFLFLRYLSDNYEEAVKKELGQGVVLQQLIGLSILMKVFQNRSCTPPPSKQISLKEISI